MFELNGSDIWGGGQLLAFSGLDGKTDFRLGLVGQTSFSGAGLEIMVPAYCELLFCDSLPKKTQISSNCFELEFATQKNRGLFLDAYHLLIEGPCKPSNTTDKLAIITEGNKTLIAVRSYLDADKINCCVDEEIARHKNWPAAGKLPSNLSSPCQKTLKKAFSQMKGQVCSPEGVFKHRWTTPDRWPHRGLWLWDSVFHAVGFRHLDIGLARDILMAVLDTQREDGFVPICATPFQNNMKITQPAILCLGVKLVLDIDQNIDWLGKVYPALVKYVLWDMANHDPDDFGLVSWENPDALETRGSNASGMDNSPRFDQTCDFKAVDFNSYLAMECEFLSDFATKLGFEEDIKRFRQLKEDICFKINKYMWNPEEGFYFDYDSNKATQSKIMASSGFMPLICGAANQEQVDSLIKQLDNPETFGTSLLVPSVARNTDYYTKDMWRGPVWTNINWLIAYGFDRCGSHGIAERIHSKTIKAIEKYYLELGSLFEYYDSDDQVKPTQLFRKGKLAPKESPYHQVISDYGWTASTYVDMVLHSTNKFLKGRRNYE